MIKIKNSYTFERRNSCTINNKSAKNNLQRSEYIKNIRAKLMKRKIEKRFPK